MSTNARIALFAATVCTVLALLVVWGLSDRISSGQGPGATGAPIGATTPSGSVGVRAADIAPATGSVAVVPSEEAEDDGEYYED